MNEQQYIEALRKASAKLRELIAENAALKIREPIAVIGIGCRFPGGANSPESFWRLLEDGRDAVDEIPSARWDVDRYYDPDPQAPGRMYTRSGGFLDRVEEFDAAFFGISPKEAESMDPQQRIALEVSWEAFEHANLNVRSLRGSKTGVFLGLSNYDYIQAHIHSGDVTRITPHSGSGVMFSTAAGRLSYTYDFRGPCLTVDTACSSSLTALHLAAGSLQSGESDLALAGGVNLLLSLDSYIALSKVNALSADGRCRAFDDSASGYGRGEGCGFLVLRRLSDAIRGGDRILALIKGSAMNHDGRSNGLTAPNGPAQQAVIREALVHAGLEPAQIDYIEAHGTGTSLGDPIEFQSLEAVFAGARERKLLLGSVKTNIGHTEAAAGIAGVIKAILAMGRGTIPASLHYDKPNRHIAWSNSGIEVTGDSRPWPDSSVRAAGVSSFGLSGTNAHVILQQAPAPAEGSEFARPAERACYILPVSAASEYSLRALGSEYAEALAAHGKWELTDFCSAAARRAAFSHREAFIAKDKGAMVEALRNPGPPSVVRRRIERTGSNGLVFVYPGQGAQYTGMAQELFRSSRIFREALELCDEAIREELGGSLIHCIQSGTLGGKELDSTAIAQPALCAVEYALTQLWNSWGVYPSAVLGHSVGEFCAASVAGVMPIETALRLAARRGRFMGDLPAGGAMAAVLASEEEFRTALDGCNGVWVAAVNGPSSITISGGEAEVASVQRMLDGKGIESRRLRVSHAFHSPLVVPAAARFQATIGALALKAPQLPFFSTVTGRAATPRELISPEYWAGQIARPVRFQSAVEAARDAGYDAFLEAGPDQTLTALGRQAFGADALWIASLRRGAGDWQSLCLCAAELYVHGFDPAWENFPEAAPRRHLDIPTYAFERKRYWMEPGPLRPENQVRHTEQSSTPTPMQTTDSVSDGIRDLLAETGGFEPAGLNPAQNLMELGFDSLMLVRVAQRIQARWGVEIKIGQFFQELTSLAELSRYVEENHTVDREPAAPASDPVTSAQPATTPAAVHGAPFDAAASGAAASSGPVAALFQQQVEALSRIAAQNMEALSSLTRQQIAVLGHSSAAAVAASSTIPSPAPRPPADSPTAPPSVPAPRVARVNFRGIQLGRKGVLSPKQRGFIDAVVHRHVERTSGSRSVTQASRDVLADWKHTLSYWGQLKEAKYPIVSARSRGSRFHDVDGNEYIDIAMGMGVHFLGHTPPFVAQALTRQLEEGMELGTQCDRTGDVALLIRELTGVERVAFSNTGTEAVMVAIRLARAATRRNRLVLFKGSYHGIFDGVLAAEEDGIIVPVGLGTPAGMIEDVDVLTYDSEESLERIAREAGSIAAILVEPVQSRNPDLQPQWFLRELRRLTREKGIALIFDEMINGFRIAAGGAQAWFGIEADIVAYGKIAGGGLPIGVIAGKAKFLDYIDGGAWQYGDQSAPKAEMIYFGGTFGRNPMTMAAAHAALSYIREHRAEIYDRLNQSTTEFCDRLNLFFETERAPLHAQHFSSQWRLTPLGDSESHPIEMELLYLLLMGRGVYVWERRINFFSTEHSAADIDHVYRSIVESVLEIRAGGFTFEAAPNAPRTFASLSSVQRRLYAVCQRPGAELAYHLPQCFFVNGPLDVDRIEDCFARIVRRHESLRAGFLSIDGQLTLKVVEEPRFSVERYACGEEEIDGIREAFFRRPFDLAKPPLLRVAVLELNPARFMLLADAHHIAVDGMSFNVIASEIMALYAGQNLPPVERQLRECMGIQSGIAERAAAGERFWREELRGPLPVLELPAKGARPAVQTFAGAHMFGQIEPAVTQALKDVCRRTGSSLYMVLLTSWNVLLHRLTGSEDILVGGPASGRLDSRLHNAVGMFVNTVVFRNRPRGDRPLRELLNEVRRNCARVYEHQDYPFEEVVRLDDSRPANRNSFFDTMLSYEDGSARSFELRDLTFSRADFALPSSMFDFSLDVVEEAGALNLDFSWRTDICDADSVLRWSGYFRRILQSFPASLDTEVGSIEIADAEEIGNRTRWNDTSCAYPANATIASLFDDQVRRSPRSVAVLKPDEAGGDVELTYSDLNARADRVAHSLRENAGVASGDFVALLLPPSELTVIAILGTLKAAAAYVPVDIEYPEERIAFMLRDCGARAILTTPELIRLVPQDCRSLVLDIGRCEAMPSGYTLVSGASPDNVAYVIYTSGSTGQPKGCLITHRNVVRLLKNDRSDFDFDSRDVWIVAHSFCFDFSVWEMFGALLNGGRLVVPAKHEIRDTARFLELLRRYRVTILNQTPGAFYNLAALEMAAADHSLDTNLRQVIFGGDRLEPVYLREWVGLYPLSRIRLVNMFGITETTVHVTFGPLSDSDIFGGESRSPIGRPLPETRVYVCNPQMRLQPTGVAGEMYVGGSGVCKGYLNRPELTRERFIASPFVAGETLYRTGDLGRYTAGGTLEYLGRNDEQVQVRGHRVETAEIVQRLLEFPGVEKAIAVAHGTGLAAWIVASAPVTVNELRAFLNARLPDYMIPAHFAQIGAFPLTANGKVDTKALPALELSAVSAGADRIPPANETETQIARIWQEILGGSGAGVLDNYYASGGDSIRAIQLVSRLCKAGLNLRVRDVLEHPTIRDLAQIATREKVPGSSTAVVVEATLTPVQRWFFESHQTDRFHFNQSVLLRAAGPLDPEINRRASACVFERHGSLRLRFEARGREWKQTIARFEQVALPFEFVDLRAAADPAGALEAHAARTQASFDLGSGSLARFVQYRLADGDRLLIAVHHLGIDGVSWRILLDDLNEARRMASASGQATLPVAKSSYLDWAHRLTEYSSSPELLAQLPYWAARERAEIRAPHPENRYGENRSVDMTLTQAETAGVFDFARGEGRDALSVLLGGLAQALRNQTGQDTIRVLLEGHGREDIAGIDVHEITGWFTSLFPVVLDLAACSGMLAVVERVEATLKAIPDKGVGYSILRYLTPPDLLQGLTFGSLPEIAFNYLGHFDAAVGEELTLSDESAGPAHGARLERSQLLEFEAVVLRGALKLSVAFCPAIHNREELTAVMNDFRDALLSLTHDNANRDADRILNLAPMQEGMLFHALEGGSDSYFEQFRYRIHGPIDIGLFEAAWNALIERHEALRGSFSEAGQRIHRAARIPFVVEDLRSQPAPFERIEAFLREDRSRGFDLTQAPLMRLALFRLDDERSEMVWSHHHIVLDGWSVAILWREFPVIYRALRAGVRAALPEAAGYSEYLRWHAGTDRRSSREFWRAYLEESVLSTLPRTGSAVGPYALEEDTLRLSPEDTGTLAQLATAERATLNAVVQSIWAALLAYYTDSRDVTFGAVLSGRPPHLPGVETMVGLFLQSVPVRARWQGDISFRDLIRLLRDNAAVCEEHQYLPLGDMQMLSGTNRPVFDHLIVFENYPVDEHADASPFPVEFVSGFEQIHYDFSLVVQPGAQLEVKFTFNANAIDRGLIHRIAARFGAIAAHVVEHPSAHISELPLFEASASAEGNPSPSAKTTVLRQFERQATLRPGAVAIEFGNESIAYAELNARAESIALRLARSGTEKGTLVAIFIPNGISYTAALLGVQKAGGIFVPMDVAAPPVRLSAMLETVQPRVILSESAWLSALPAQYAVINLDAPDLEAPQEENPPVSLSPVSVDDDAYVVFTSGSTGKPKAILGAHDGLAHFIAWEHDEFGIDSSSRISNFAATTFDASLRDLFAPLCAGGVVCIPPAAARDDLSSLVKWFAESRITLTHMVPSVCRLIVKELESSPAAGDFRSLRHILLAGEPLFGKDVMRARSVFPHGVEVVNLYGPSETVMVKCFHRLPPSADVPEGLLPIGRPIAGTALRILKDNRLAAAGAAGEICIATPFLCRGYFKDPKLTATRFFADPASDRPDRVVYRTGDIGRELAGGIFECLGRLDRQVKVRGVRVELGEVDSAILESPEIDQTIAVVQKRHDGEGALVCYYTETSPVDRDVLRQRLAQRLPPAMMPDILVCLPEFPLNVNGKIDVRALPRPEELIEERYPYEPPASDNEKRVTEIWQDAIGNPRIGVNSPFHEVGGNSLAAIRIISAINREWGASVTIRAFFERATIRRVAEVLGLGGNEKTLPIERLPASESYPLSHSQRRLWILDRLAGGSSAYSLPAALQLDGPLSAAALSSAFRALVDRHESLRTTFRNRGGEPRQFVAEWSSFALNTIDLRDHAEPETVARRFAEEDAQRPFDLEHGPLLRATLLRTAPERHILLFNIHHIVSDAPSLAVLTGEIFTLYSGSRSLPPLTIHYRDFAAWQNALISNGRAIAAQREYWLKQLAGPLPVLDLPTDRPRAPHQTFEGDRVTLGIDAAVTKKLSALAASLRTTTFAALASAVKALLHRHTGQQDIVIGTPVSLRDQPVLENQIGFYVNMLALRDQVSPHLTVTELLESVRDTVNGALDNRHYPFDLLVEDILVENPGVGREAGRSPIFEVAVVLQNGRRGAPALEGIGVTELRPETRVSKYALSFEFIDHAEGIRLNIEYSTALFDRWRVGALGRHLGVLIESMANSPHAEIGALPLMDRVESQAVAAFGVNPARIENRGTIEIFESVAAAHASRTAVVCEDVELTYAALNESVNRLAYDLKARGIGRGDRVAFLTDRSELLPIAFLGVLKTGAVFVPMDSSYPRARVEFMLNDAGCRAVLADENTPELDVPAGALRVDIRSALTGPANEASNPPLACRPGDTAYVIYTSGSTGTPKGVLLEHTGVCNVTSAFCAQMGITAEHRVLQFAPAAFDACVWEMLISLLRGAALIIAGRSRIEDTARFTEYLNEKKVSVATLPPSYAAQLNPAKLQSLEILVTAGEAPSPGVVRAFARRLRYINAYGPTEASVCASCYELTDLESPHRAIPIGRPLPNAEILVLDAQFAAAPIGVIGEIWLGGIGVALGYHNRPELTRAAFLPDPTRPGERIYRTGDLGFWRPDGLLEFTGRADSQVKIRGNRVELGEVEELLLRHEDVKEAAVVWNGEELTACIAGAGLSADSLRDHLGRYAPAFMTPSVWKFAEKLPRLPNGKVDRAALAAIPRSLDPELPAEAPRNDLEKLISDVWCSVLRADRIGRGENFLYVGGDSIRAIQIVDRLRRAGHSVRPRDIYESPTIAALAARLAAATPQIKALSTAAAAVSVSESELAELFEP
jgi:amino acid adenylation domain-containing protein/non-ribosomal peptide synthase protein (TIGR01720 family)